MGLHENLPSPFFAVLRHLLGTVGVLMLAAQALAANCAEWNTRQFFVSATWEEVTACLEAEAELHARNTSGNSPLHWAAQSSDNPAIIEVLVEVEQR